MEPEVQVIKQVRVLWASPGEGSVYMKAKEAMVAAEEKILATAMRSLALIQANDKTEVLNPADVIEWLESMKSNIEWLKHHIQHDLDLQRDIPALVPEHLRKQCEQCGRWFVPKRSTAKYDTDNCRQKAHYNKKSNAKN